jgi:hypothetical protein
VTGFVINARTVRDRLVSIAGHGSLLVGGNGNGPILRIFYRGR